MILIDSNVFMYAAGRAHPHKDPSRAFLRQVATEQIEALIDTEVLQEILHRYRSIGQWEKGQRVFDLARTIVPVVTPMTVECLDEARRLMQRHSNLSARDAVHAAVVRVRGLAGICTYDQDFDELEWIERIEPSIATS